MLGLWDERAAGTPGEGAPVGVQCTPMHLPNRRRRDPYVRWCGRGEAVRPLPIPIRSSDKPPSEGLLNLVAVH